MVRVDKGDGLVYLVSGAAHRGETKDYVTFPYDEFERVVLRYLGELKKDDILPASSAPNALHDELEAVEGRLDALAKRISMATKALDDGGEIESGFALLKKWESERKELTTQRDRLRRELTTADATNLADTQETLDLFDQAKGDDLYILRQRTSSRFATW